MSHALAVLEFSRVLEAVAERTTSDAGRERVLALEPSNDRAWIEREHARIAAVRALRSSEGGWGPEPVPAPGRSVAKLKVAEAGWTPEEARNIGVLLASAAKTARSVRDPRKPPAAVAVLAPLIDSLVAAPALEKAIARAIDDDANVRDDASPLLRRLRRELREAEANLVRTLERVIARLDPDQQVPDASVTIRNGRYVIPVRRDARNTIGGIVHDTSATGATLFVEPPAGIEAANRIRQMEIEAAREVDRILMELTDLARPEVDAIEATFGSLAELDSLHARARWADELDCAPVELVGPGDAIVIHGGRHPLLLARGVEVVPFELHLDGADRTMLVSGPNTGGKTVLLKALGLFHAMCQAGIPVPVENGSALPLVDNIFADIGDEQSIEASLSTFSAHLKNLREILLSATADSLVLIDELGSGTDPAEGAALGAAILENLTKRGVRSVATTHLGALKDLPLTVPGVVNASLQFDEQKLAPTYRLLQGIPGRSYGLSIARRLELPVSVIERAVARVPEQERAVSALLADLERREAELGEREVQMNRDEEARREQGQRITERERKVRARERDVERNARAEARRYLLEARAEVERTIASLRAASESERQEAERAARRGLERLAGEHAHALDALEEKTAAARASGDAGEMAAGGAGEIAAGALVEVASLGGRAGRVADIRGSEALVAFGAVKVTVPVAELRLSKGPQAPAAAYGQLPEHDAKPEVDLRGARVSEVDERVLGALDAAVRADLKTLRIIHGKGTGALRERVAEMLSKDVRVKSHRLGAWNEGGAGVTIAEIA